jgi:hypothetical protein
MDELLTLFQQILKVNDPKLHPIVNTYNPVKTSLLIFEICWRIQ